jgi:hypothetical protein
MIHNHVDHQAAATDSQSTATSKGKPIISAAVLTVAQSRARGTAIFNLTAQL